MEKNTYLIKLNEICKQLYTENDPQIKIQLVVNACFLCYAQQDVYMLYIIYHKYLINEKNIFDPQFEEIIAKIINTIKNTESLLQYPNIKNVCNIDNYIDNIYKYNFEYYDVSTHPTPANKGTGIIFTITTCKRIDLFERTINSFLHCCNDKNLIDTWLCVDDNSSESDRQEMKRLYPFFKFYFKSADIKGHAISMNIILSESVNYDYILHMEDDWTFFIKDEYISNCIDVLSENEMYGQCLFNLNYAEVIQDVDKIKGGIYVHGKNYVIHEHYQPDSQDMFNFLKRINYNPSCAYWKHYSLRPSLLKRSMYTQVGQFTNIPQFEMEYADRYISKGYKSVFLNGIGCFHTGRLTSERFDNDKHNAYDMNSELQFIYKSNIKKYIVNLKRRPDRWDNFINLNKGKIYNYTRFPAIDGNKLKNTRQLQRLFDNNDYNYKKGMVGCAISHLYIWINFLLNTDEEVIIVIEDDANINDEFEKNVDNLNEYKDWDFLFLGHYLRPQFKSSITYDNILFPERWNSHMSLARSIGGTIGYMIRRKGAVRILDYINAKGMTNCIDTMIQKSGDIMNMSYSFPSVINGDCADGTNQIDTDIQTNNDSFFIDQDQLIKNEKEFYEKMGIPVCINEDDNNCNVIISTDLQVFNKKYKYNLGNEQYAVWVYLDCVNDMIIRHSTIERLKICTNKVMKFDISDILEGYDEN